METSFHGSDVRQSTLSRRSVTSSKQSTPPCMKIFSLSLDNSKLALHSRKSLLNWRNLCHCDKQQVQETLAALLLQERINGISNNSFTLSRCIVTSRIFRDGTKYFLIWNPPLVCVYVLEQYRLFKRWKKIGRFHNFRTATNLCF